MVHQSHGSPHARVFRPPPGIMCLDSSFEVRRPAGIVSSVGTLNDIGITGQIFSLSMVKAPSCMSMIPLQARVYTDWSRNLREFLCVTSCPWWLKSVLNTVIRTIRVLFIPIYFLSSSRLLLLFISVYDPAAKKRLQYLFAQLRQFHCVATFLQPFSLAPFIQPPLARIEGLA